MCGRFALTVSPAVLAKLFQLEDINPFEASYNIAPGRSIAAVVESGKGAKDGKAPVGDAAPVRRLKQFRWGLVPVWAKDPAVGNRLINARSETAHQKPAFRDAFKSRRCLIPADGFYEWQKRPSGKQPFFFRLRDEPILAMAGLWQTWSGPDGNFTESCAILTTSANDLMRPIHDRMPVLIRPGDFSLWLAPPACPIQTLQKLLKPFPPDPMIAYPVGPLVNNTRNNDPRCLRPLETDADLFKRL